MKYKNQFYKPTRRVLLLNNEVSCWNTVGTKKWPEGEDEANQTTATAVDEIPFHDTIVR